MRIGELAKRSGLAASRIRFYEASGLIKSVERTSNGYRDYAPDAEWLLEMITSAQSAGFSLEEIRHLLPLAQQGWQHDTLLDGIKRKVAEIEALQARLEQNKARLQAVIHGMENGPAGMTCEDRAKWVMDRVRTDA
jgi:DNA-binding transcriptional MerR regulator